MPDHFIDVDEPLLEESQASEALDSLEDRDVVQIPSESQQNYPILSIESVITGRQAFWLITKKGLVIAISLTSNLATPIMGAMLRRLCQTNTECAANALNLSFVNVFPVLGVGVLFAMFNIASEYRGKIRRLLETAPLETSSIQRARNRMADNNKQGMMIVAASIPVISSIFFFSDWILVTIFRQDPEVTTVAANFLKYYAMAYPGFAFTVCFSQTLIVDHANAAMSFGLMSLGASTFLAYYLSFMRDLGTRGVAIGFSALPIMTTVIYGAYLALHSDFKDIQFFNFRQFESGAMKRFYRLLKLGGQIYFSVVNELVIALLTTMLTGLLGLLSEAAWALPMLLIPWVLLFVYGFGAACSGVISTEIGASCYQNANRVAKYGLLANLSCTAVLSLPFALDPYLLYDLMGGGQEDIKPMLTWLMPLVVLWVIAESGRFNLVQQMRALNNMVVANVISLVMMSFGLGVAVLFAFVLSLGIDGVALGAALGSGLALAGILRYWRHDIVPDNIEARKTGLEVIKPWYSSFKATCCSFFSTVATEETGAPQSQVQSPLGEATREFSDVASMVTIVRTRETQISTSTSFFGDLWKWVRREENGTTPTQITDLVVS